MPSDNRRFQGMWLDPATIKEIEDLTTVHYSDTIRMALKIGLRRMRKGKRK